MADLRAWLDANGLGAILDILTRNDIGLDLLPELSDDDLKELGLSLGHRRRLLKALREQPDPATGSTASDPVTAQRAERRQLTLMFVDLVGSTALSSRLDPEDMQALIRAFQDTVAGQIARLDGHVAKFMGDGVLAYFGWPAAHEDEAERAIRAGLSIVDSVSNLRTADNRTLAARVGIATGLVVVGDLVGEGAAREQAVVGETPNLAARLQEAARGGQVVVGEQTRRLAHLAFDFEDLGRRELKGFDAPVAMFAVTGERAPSQRFERQTGSLFGRDQELALLLERWSRAMSDEGQGVLLTGEAGIGKSRLTRALMDSIRSQAHFQLRYQCSPYHRDSPLWPVIQQLTHAAGLQLDDPPDEQLDKIESLLRLGGDPNESAPLIANLLGIDASARYGVLDLSPQVLRGRTLVALVDQLVGLAASRPVLVVLEDAHWIDPTTLEMFQLSLDRIERARVMVLLTSRPDREPPLAGHPHITRLMLNRLSRQAVEAITSYVAGAHHLPPALVAQIMARTDGIPLFVEELTKTIVELAPGEAQRSDSGWDSALIPATLHDSLMARLDRVPEVKRVAQLAACIGREFDYPTLTAIAGLAPAALESALGRLEAAELVFRRGMVPESSYTFKHALVRDAAANSLLLSDRRQIHAEIVRALEVAVPPPAPELIAQHAEAAAQPDKALMQWLKAGNLAVGRYANREAVRHFRRGLELLRALPDDDMRNRRELEILVALGVPLIAAHGYASAEVEENQLRACRLAERLGADDQLFSALRGLWNCVFDRADLDQSATIGHRLLTLAQRRGSAESVGLARRALGTTQFNRGALDEALEHFRLGLEACATLTPAAGLQEHGEAPIIVSMVYMGWVECVQGRLGAGLASGERALVMARGASHPLIEAFAAQIMCNVLRERNEPQPCRELADRTLALAREHGLVFWVAGLTIMDGWCRACLGDPRRGAAGIRTGIAAWKATGAKLHLPTWHFCLAEALLAGGALDEALETLGEARGMAVDNGEHLMHAEHERLLAELQVRLGNPAAADEALERALETARAQSARLFELRAATARARLWATEGRGRPALDLLAPVLAHFADEPETATVRNARRLMSDLRRA